MTQPLYHTVAWNAVHAEVSLRPTYNTDAVVGLVVPRDQWHTYFLYLSRNSLCLPKNIDDKPIYIVKRVDTNLDHALSWSSYLVGVLQVGRKVYNVRWARDESKSGHQEQRRKE